jgi:Flp pilus assembly protein TadD
MAPRFPESSRWRDVPWALALIVLVFVAYLPAWSGEFVWDDDLVVAANPVISGPLGLREIWTTAAADVCPLTLTTFWIEYQIWSATTWPYHVVTLLLHGLAAVVLWRVLRRLGAPAAWFGAALWALHPVMAESVAWISEMKNTESGLFFLLSILFFLRWLEEQKPEGRLRWTTDYSLVLLFAFCAMACKSSTIILPVILCLCAWWQERDGWWRKAVFTLPLVPMSCLFAVVSVATQTIQSVIANDPIPVRTFPARLADAGIAVWFYLGKLIWPHPLVTIYPAWKTDPGSVIDYLPFMAVFVALIALGWLRTGWARPCFFAFAWFVVALMPVLGLVDNFIFRYSLVFDHFQYLASMGPLTLAGCALGFSARRLAPTIGLRTALGVVILSVLGTLTWQRAAVFSSEASLWNDTLAKNPGSWLAQSNVGQSLAFAGRYDEGIAHDRAALQLYPTSPETHLNLGSALMAKGEIDEAIVHYQAAIKLYPGFFEAHKALANALLAKHRLDDAIPEYRALIAFRPNDATAHFGLGNALAQKNDMAGAAAQFQIAVQLEPGRSLYHNNLGAALYQLGRNPEATTEFAEALRLDPRSTDAQSNLAKAQARAARTEHR